MYTALHLGVELKKPPQQVIDVLTFMVEHDQDTPAPSPLPDHPLFKTDGWPYMLQMGSYYFDYQTHAEFVYDEIASSWFLSVTSNLKNYGNEIDKFIDWLMPFVDGYPGKFLGYTRYEEDEDPTIVKIPERAK